MMAPLLGTPPVPVPPAGLAPDTSPPPGSVPPCPPRPVIPLEVSGVTGDEPAASVPFLLEEPLRDGCLTWGAELPGALEPADVAPESLDWAKVDVDSKMPTGSTAQERTRIDIIISVLGSKANLIRASINQTPALAYPSVRGEGVGLTAKRARLDSVKTY
jgi:hypothetical protein